jgi:vacuolar-type H+-ATPase subunit F/Vma7
MKRAAAIGDDRRLAGYRLAGVEVTHAGSAAEAEAAWAALDDEAGLLLLTPDAHAALAPRLAERDIVWVVVPS